MNTHRPMHDNGSPRSGEADPPPSERTELVRAAADGELTAAQERSLRDHLASHPEDQAVIAFERELRRAVATSATGAPSRALQEKVEAMAGIDGIASPADSPAILGAAPSRWRIRSPRWLAVAASVSLIAGVAYFLARPAPSVPPPGQLIIASHRVALASFVGSQHKECELHADMVSNHFRITSLDTAPSALSEILGNAPDLGRIVESGLTFKGAGPCAVPGRGRSVHMVFEERTPRVQGTAATPTLVSIFVQQDAGELNIEPGRTYRLVPKGGGSGATAYEIFVWKQDGLIYFLSSASDRAIETARLALGAQEPSGNL